ncbi:ATP-dependent DNA helicase RecQ [Rhizina undulata]
MLRNLQALGAHTILQGQDVVVIVPTSGGKSIAFQSIAMAKPDNIILVICPISSLKQDQGRFLNKVGILVCTLSKEAMQPNPALLSGIANGQFQIIYAFPGLVLPDNSNFSKIVNGANSCFRQRVIAIIFDEVHCTYRCTKLAFRPAYANMGSLRAFFPKVPFMCLSAILPSRSLTWIHNNLHLTPNTLLIKNAINRPNIYLACAPIQGNLDIREDLNILIPPITDTSYFMPESIPKTMLFVDDRVSAQDIVFQLMQLLPVPLQHLPGVRAYSSITSRKVNEKHVQLFICGEIRILGYTDAAGLGVNIEDVERIVQWNLPLSNSFDTLWQSIGRCVRNKDLKGMGLLFFEHDKAVTPMENSSTEDDVQSGYDRSSLISFLRKAEPGCEDFVMYLYTDSQVKKFSSRSKVSVDPRLVCFTSTTSCRRQVILYLLSDNQAGKPFPNSTSDTPNYGNCDNCIKLQLTRDLSNDRNQNCGSEVGSDRVVSSQPGYLPVSDKIQGIPIEFFAPFTTTRKRRKQAPQPRLNPASTINKKTFILKCLHLWDLDMWKLEISANSDEFTVVPFFFDATGWLASL